MSIFKKTVMTLASLALFAINAHASATAVYIAQNGAGAANGADCADARPVSFFNNSGNWGSGSNQIGPGTTVHLCGTFTGAPGSTMLTIQGSGASGNPVTVLFENGAQLNAPYWGGNPFTVGGAAIVCNGNNYITVDGGTNGIIQNTANGSAALGYSNQQVSQGVAFSNCNHVEIRNLSVQNIYVHADGDTGGHDAQAIGVGYGDFVSIHNNVVNNAFVGIGLGYSTVASGGNVTSANIYGNTIDHACHHLNIGDGSNNSSASGINVYNNTIGPHFQDWTSADQGCHSDGMIVSAFNSGSSLTNSTFYNNTITSDMCSVPGDPGENCTGWMFFTGNMSSISIFNNVLISTAPASGYEALLRIAPTSYSGASMANFRIFNNVFAGNNSTDGCDCAAIKTDGTASGLSLLNNIFIHFANTAVLNEVGTLASVFGGQINYNDYYDVKQFGVDFTNNQHYSTLAQWRSAGFDTNGSNANPMLGANLSPQAGSAAMTLGANLSAIGISALNSDKLGIPRPTTGPWAVGAYQGSVVAPAPPSALAAIVN